MSLGSTLSGPILETILNGLATLFLTGANGDQTAARHAALQLLGIYDLRTEDELRLAAQIVGFSFRALDVLSHASKPDLTVIQQLRLQASAVGLSREAGRAERRLVQLQKLRAPVTRPETTETLPQPKQLPVSRQTIAPPPEALFHATRNTVAFKEISALREQRAEEDRQRDIRIAAGLKRAEERRAEQADRPMPGDGPDHGSPAQAAAPSLQTATAPA